MSTTNDPRRREDDNTSDRPRRSQHDQQGALGSVTGAVSSATFGAIDADTATDRGVYDSEPVQEPIDVELGYEPRDFKPGPFGRLAIGFVVLAILGSIVGYYFFGFLRSLDAAKERYASPVMAQPQIPPAPQLQVSPPADMQKYLANEEQLLRSTQWIDQKNGVVRIPIDQAMKLTLQRGLPARQGQGGARDLFSGTYDQTQDLDSEGGVPAGTTVTP